MRASMSVPGVFAPVEYRGQLLVDGGLVDNLPIDVARAMGVDVLIVVDAGFPLQPRKSLDFAAQHHQSDAVDPAAHEISISRSPRCATGHGRQPAARRFLLL